MFRNEILKDGRLHEYFRSELFGKKNILRSIRGGKRKYDERNEKRKKNRKNERSSHHSTLGVIDSTNRVAKKSEEERERKIDRGLGNLYVPSFFSVFKYKAFVLIFLSFSRANRG